MPATPVEIRQLCKIGAWPPMALRFHLPGKVRTWSKKQSDGNSLLVIDNPFGSEGI